MGKLNRFGIRKNRFAGLKFRVTNSILSLVRHNVGKLCRNDLDRIYALLGLQNNNRDVDIEGRYNGNVEHVYKAIAL